MTSLAEKPRLAESAILETDERNTFDWFRPSDQEVRNCGELYGAGVGPKKGS